MIEVDHVVEIGSFTGDWNEYINKMFCDDNLENLQALCVPCHSLKSTAGNATLRYQRKAKAQES